MPRYLQPYEWQATHDRLDHAWLDLQDANDALAANIEDPMLEYTAHEVFTTYTWVLADLVLALRRNWPADKQTDTAGQQITLM